MAGPFASVSKAARKASCILPMASLPTSGFMCGSRRMVLSVSTASSAEEFLAAAALK
jgi:hypothetical protein